MAQQQVECRGASLGGLCVVLWHLVWSGHLHQGGLDEVGVEAPSSSAMLGVLTSHRDLWSLWPGFFKDSIWFSQDHFCFPWPLPP